MALDIRKVRHVTNDVAVRACVKHLEGSATAQVCGSAMRVQWSAQTMRNARRAVGLRLRMTLKMRDVRRKERAYDNRVRHTTVASSCVRRHTGDGSEEAPRPGTAKATEGSGRKDARVHMRGTYITLKRAKCDLKSEGYRKPGRVTPGDLAPHQAGWRRCDASFMSRACHPLPTRDSETRWRTCIANETNERTRASTSHHYSQKRSKKKHRENFALNSKIPLAVDRPAWM